MSEISEIELYVIQKVKELRTQAGISQKDLSLKLGFSEGFVGNIENPRLKEKYNLRHLNALAKVLKCSPKNFLPEEAL